MILERIKTATAENHKNIENSPLMLPLSEQTLTKAHYGGILYKFYGYFAPVEDNLKRIDKLEQHLTDFPQRRKSHLLLEDMKVLGLNDKNIPVCTVLPPLNSLSQAFGCLYVLEGSTLGGQFISKIVKKELELSDERGTTFFSGYGKETGKRWKMFQEALVAYTRSSLSSEEDIIIASANETFIKLENWLNAAN